MDKAMMKVVFRAGGLRVPDWVVVLRASGSPIRGGHDPGSSARPYPLFVKPANLGSSVASRRCTDRRSWHPRGRRRRLRSKVVVELAVPEAREISVQFWQRRDQASVAGEIIPSRGVLRLRSHTSIPARASRSRRRSTTRPCATCSARRSSPEAIDGSGLARVDFLLSRTSGELYVNEINTLPGFTTISMYSKLWAATGVDYPTLVERLIALAIARHQDKQELKTSAF
jgi:D-alanine-D-alanine ligase